MPKQYEQFIIKNRASRDYSYDMRGGNLTVRAFVHGPTDFNPEVVRAVKVSICGHLTADEAAEFAQVLAEAAEWAKETKVPE